MCRAHGRAALAPIAGALLGVLCLAGPAAAQEPDWTELRVRRQAASLESLRVDIEYAVGELAVRRVDPDLLYDVTLRYDARRMQPERTWRSAGGEGHLSVRVVPEDGGVEGLDSGESGKGRIELGLGTRTPTALRVQVGAAEARLDLGGIPLSGLVYRTGASSSEITFDEPNPVRLAHVELAAGAAEFRATGLGNARFDRLSFEGAVGDVTLDFGGAWEGDAEAEISMGLGALRLVLPRGVGVEIRKKGLLAGFDPRGMVERDGAWRTPGWDDAAQRLRIEVRAAFGKVDVEFAD